MSDNDDYGRADDYIEDNDDYIFFETDMHFKEMNKEQKVQTINRLFYENNALFNHKDSAKALLAGIEARHNPEFSGEKVTIYNRLTKSGKIQMIRGANGRFKKKVR